MWSCTCGEQSSTPPVCGTRCCCSFLIGCRSSSWLSPTYRWSFSGPHVTPDLPTLSHKTMRTCQFRQIKQATCYAYRPCWKDQGELKKGIVNSKNKYNLLILNQYHILSCNAKGYILEKCIKKLLHRNTAT